MTVMSSFTGTYCSKINSSYLRSSMSWYGMIIVSLQVVQFQCLKHLCPEIALATCLMCISLCLKTNVEVGAYIFKQTDLCTLSTIKRNSLSFCRYNKPSASAYSFGTIPSFGWMLYHVYAFKKFFVSKVSENIRVKFTYGGIRALAIANLE